MSAKRKDAPPQESHIPISIIYAASLFNTSLMPLPLTSLLLHPLLVCAIPTTTTTSSRIETKIPAVTRIETASTATRRWGRKWERNRLFQLPFQTRKAVGKIGVLEFEDFDQLQDDTTSTIHVHKP